MQALFDIYLNSLMGFSVMRCRLSETASSRSGCDVFGLETVNAGLSSDEGINSMAFAPVWAGQIDHKNMFAYAKLAAALVSYENLKAIL
jgi:hypothetical protein